MLVPLMSGFLRRSLLLLLCVLVVSWGTCPCLFARMVGTVDTEPVTTASGACGCCKKNADDAPAKRSIPKPDECPCCSRGGSIRDLPPQGDSDLIDPAPVVADFVLPAVRTTTHVPIDAFDTDHEATGPPLGQGPHACPVGIVLLLS